MEKTYLFILRVYNDIDHIAPVIWKMRKMGRHVRVVFMDLNANIDIRQEPLLKFLTNEGCPVHYYYALPEALLRFPNRPFVQPTNPLKIKLFRLFREWMKRWVWTQAWADRVIKKIGPAVIAVDAHGPSPNDIEGRLVYAAKRLGVFALSLSHGPNVYVIFDRQELDPKRAVRKAFAA